MRNAPCDAAAECSTVNILNKIDFSLMSVYIKDALSLNAKYSQVDHTCRHEGVKKEIFLYYQQITQL